MIFEFFIQITRIPGLARKINIFLRFSSSGRHEQFVHNEKSALKYQIHRAYKIAYYIGRKDNFRIFYLNNPRFVLGLEN